MGRPRKRPIGPKFRLREIRESRLLTQVALASLAGVDVDTISTIENGKRMPRRDTVEKLAKALRVDVDALIEQPPQSQAA